MVLAQITAVSQSSEQQKDDVSAVLLGMSLQCHQNAHSSLTSPALLDDRDGTLQASVGPTVFDCAVLL